MASFVACMECRNLSERPQNLDREVQMRLPEWFLAPDHLQFAREETEAALRGLLIKEEALRLH